VELWQGGQCSIICCVVITQPSTAREMVTSVEQMEKDVEAKRRKLNVAGINEKSQKYLKQLKGTAVSFLPHCQQDWIF